MILIGIVEIFVIICVIAKNEYKIFSNNFRFRLHFNAESQEEIDKRKHIAKTRIIIPVDKVITMIHLNKY